ncbi:hypothetical protein Zmor_018507 [Zophobas morio]|uniref:Pre-C2HC domain-containing protein n=1 Tax=Zophobas morio TaxID=2755281 RepID=A0AA38MDK0_9CUCU|nr:hypothetical protein Zmor_018507 [Zophobas morio]
MPLVLAELPMCKKADIFEMKTLCDLSVKVEKPHKPKDAAQCHRCSPSHSNRRLPRSPPHHPRRPPPRPPPSNALFCETFTVPNPTLNHILKHRKNVPDFGSGIG